jgi:hypothetical protein
MWEIGAQLAGSLISSALGGNKGAAPAQSVQESGFKALPKEVQKYLLSNYFPKAQKLFDEGPNQWEQQGYGMLQANPEEMGQQVNEYMNPYSNAVKNPVMDRIQQETDRARTGFSDRLARGGLGAIGNRGMQYQMGQLEKNNIGQKAEAEAYLDERNYNQALGLRRQGIEDLMRAGDQGYDRLNRFAGTLAPFSSSFGSSTGANPGTPNLASQIGGGLMSLGGMAQNMPFSLANNLTGGRPWMITG